MDHTTAIRTAVALRAGQAWPRRRRRGLVNVILTVAIAAIAIVGILAAYQSVNTSIRTQNVQGTITMIEAELRRTYASQPQYAANLTGGLLSKMPSNVIQGTGADRVIVTPWGGQVFAGGGNTPDDDGTGGASNNRFYVTVLGLPEAACEAIAAAFLNRSNVVGLDVEGAAATAAARASTSRRPSSTHWSQVPDSAVRGR